MIFAAMPSPCELAPPWGGPFLGGGGSICGLEVSVREGGGAMAAPEAVEKQSPQISFFIVERFAYNNILSFILFK